MRRLDFVQNYTLRVLTIATITNYIREVDEPEGHHHHHHGHNNDDQERGGRVGSPIMGGTSRFQLLCNLGRLWHWGH